MDRKTMGSNLLLALTAFIWGVAFVAQSVGMEYVGPFTFNACRFLIGGIVLIPCILLFGKKNKKKRAKKPKNSSCGGNLLWQYSICSKLFPTIWRCQHYSRKSRIYYSTLYCDCSFIGNLSEKKNSMECVGECGTGNYRYVSIMYDRGAEK